jgi:hypothetical protein
MRKPASFSPRTTTRPTCSNPCDRSRARQARRCEGRPNAPIALETVKRIDAVFEVEREIVGLSAADHEQVK